MMHSESLGKLAAALVAAQDDIRAVEKSATNPHFKSKYVPLDAIVAMARPALARHGLTIAQSAEPYAEGKALLVETRLIHASGEWLSNAVYIPLAKQDPQGAGAAVTYGRRFGLSSLLSIASEEDDDGNNASRPPARQSSRNEARSEPRAERAAPTETPTTAPAAAATPEDVEYHGKRLGDYTDGELAAIAMQAKAAGKNKWVRAIASVRAGRSMGITKAPTLTDDQIVDNAKAAVEAETASLNFR